MAMLSESLNMLLRVVTCLKANIVLFSHLLVSIVVNINNDFQLRMSV